ncbi:MAG: sulfatase [Planctomycetota bacterium]
MSGQPTHILYLHSHDTGRYIAPYGHAVQTPNLQRFAESGVVFRHAFCANPTCSPSRACLLTGQYAHTNGMLGLAHLGGRLAEPGDTLPNHLRSQGYQTVLAGVQHVRPADGSYTTADMGYTLDLSADRKPAKPGPIGNDEATVESTCAFLAEHQGDDTPFFLDAGFFTTHRLGMDEADGLPLQWHNDDPPLGDPRYAAVPATLPDTPACRKDFADYVHAAQRLDSYYGRIFDALETHGLADRTLVIITTDHGIAFPGMKCNLTAHGTGVLLMMRGPGVTGGRVLQGLASHVDLFPTVCDVAGLPTPDRVQGVSLRPMIDADDDTASVRDEVFAEVNYHATYQPMRGVRTERYSYIRRLEEAPRIVRPNIDNSPSKSELQHAGLLERDLAAEELFDLYRDPTEACNRAEDPAYAEALSDMRARLDRWMQDTHDPALAGPVHDPRITTRPAEQYSPSK